MSVGSNGLNGIGMDQRTNKSAQTQEQISDPPPWTNHKRGMQRRRNGGPRCARERPAGHPQAGWPSTCTRQSHATHTDTTRRSGASRRRWWPDGHIPRPASLGKAGRPHLEATQAQPSRGSQAQPPYLLTTDANCFTDPEPTLEGYK